MNHSGPKYQPMVSIIIVNYNHGEFILSCVGSIERCLEDLAHEIIVVDNRSSDDSCRLLRDEFPRAILLENTSNVGFARAVNQGARVATGKYLLLVNPDVTLLPGSLEKALQFMDAHPDVALLLPKLLNPDGTLQFSCRTFPNFLAFLYRRTPLGKLFPSHKAIRVHLMLDWSHDETREVDWGLGACMLLRRDEWRNGNLFDERFSSISRISTSAFA